MGNEAAAESKPVVVGGGRAKSDRHLLDCHAVSTSSSTVSSQGQRDRFLASIAVPTPVTTWKPTDRPRWRRNLARFFAVINSFPARRELHVLFEHAQHFDVIQVGRPDRVRWWLLGEVYRSSVRFRRRDFTKNKTNNTQGTERPPTFWTRWP